MKNKAFFIPVILISQLIMAACGNFPIESYPSKVFILIRHAEKIDDSEDAELSQEGEDRAERLAELLSSIPIEAIYSTPYRRTQATVQPLASRLQLNPISYNGRNLGKFTEELLRANHQWTVICGHSNSTPQLANHLIGKSIYTEFPHSDYSRILVIHMVGKKAISHYMLHY